jgi:peptidoglycan/LPS O-acetylase OafA/YrhL
MAARGRAASAAGRLDFLDALRGLAALAVFAQHAGLALSYRYRSFALSIFDLGNFGVMLFFLCSGFIIPVSLERQGSLQRFWVRRLLRLFPLYWFCIALALLLGSANGWSHFPAEFAAQPLAFVAANLTMLQTLFGFPHLIGAAWTLMFELLFYIIVSAQFKLGLSRSTVPIAIGFLSAAIAAEGAAPLVAGLQLPNGILSFFGTMYVGTLLYRYVNGELSRQTLIYLLGFAIFTEIVTLVGDIRSAEGVWLQWITARVLAYGVFVGALAVRNRQIPSLLCRLGLISYSLYLLHPFVMQLVPPGANPWLTAAMWLAILIPIAALTYRTIEQPGMHLGRLLTRAAPAGKRLGANDLASPQVAPPAAGQTLALTLGEAPPADAPGPA